MNKIEIEIPEGKKAEWVNSVLTLVDDDVKVRIKTFEDACNELGENHQYVRAYREWMRISYVECEDIAAYMKLRIITAALNEGWEPQFVKGELRWYVWFSNKYAGRVYAYANGAGSNSYADHGVRLAFRTKELAEYCGKQFLHIWADYLLR